MKKNKYGWRLICFCLITITLFGEIFLICLIMKDEKTINVTSRNAIEINDYSIENKNHIYKYTAENLKYDIEEANNNAEKIKDGPNIDKIEESLVEYLNEYDDKIGLVFYDINSERVIKINENEEFVGASTYKVFMNIAAYETIKSGYGSLDDVIYYSDVYYEDGTGILQSENFSCLDVQTLLDYSIIYSDNIATNMVTGYLGGMYTVLYTVGEILDESICVSDNIITPNQMFAALKFIYDNKGEEYYSHMIETMEKTIFHERIDKDLPQEIVAHKIGTYGMYIHDVGIVFVKDNPYILVVYTCGIDNADEVISNISNIIYNEYDKL